MEMSYILKDDVKFPNFSQDAANFFNAMGPLAPFPKKGVRALQRDYLVFVQLCLKYVVPAHTYQDFPFNLYMMYQVNGIQGEMGGVFLQFLFIHHIKASCGDNLVLLHFVSPSI